MDANPTAASAPVLDANANTHGTMKIENTEKRGALRAIEEKYQRLWQEEKVFESNAPSCSEYPPDTVPIDELWLKAPKFFDATRVALANGGDGIDDANFEETSANATILKLFELKRWMENTVRHARLLESGEEFDQVRATVKSENVDSIQRVGAMTFWDSLFMNDINVLISQTVQSYRLTNFKAALKSGFYDFTAARDTYRSATHSASVGMHHECVRYYVESQALMLCIFAPHWADYIWREVLLKPSTIQLEAFPDIPEPSIALQATSDYVKTTMARIMTAHTSQQKRLAKGKGLLFDPTKG